MTTSEIAAAVAAVVLLAVLAAVLTRAGRRGHRNTLHEVDSFARARSLTTRWASHPETSPRPVADAPTDAHALTEQE